MCFIKKKYYVLDLAHPTESNVCRIVAGLGHSPVGKGIEVAAEVRNELLRQLLRGGAAGVELLEAAEKERRFLADGARRGVARETVQVERVLERLDGAGEVAAQALPLLGRRRARGRVTGAGGVGAGGEGAVRAGVGPHEDLLHHGLLVGARPARPALQRGRHR